MGGPMSRPDGGGLPPTGPGLTPPGRGDSVDPGVAGEGDIGEDAGGQRTGGMAGEG
jgi:hypothetical protein